MILSVMYFEAKATPIQRGAPITDTNKVGLMPTPTSISKIVADKNRWTVTNHPIHRVLSLIKDNFLILIYKKSKIHSLLFYYLNALTPILSKKDFF